ncbi:uncharacterized protein LOC121467803 [Drosophila elegans]|uniref:uncharacterized protein LOC121467803 n=1 Tax=Drosophila elegans TaxID=30023 RepID=UPI001BC85F99|nr:uncharacterized protein LOC121467803 [Drosophila elegans]
MLVHISKLVGLHTLCLNRICLDRVLGEFSSLVKLEQLTLGQSYGASESALLKLFNSCRKLNIWKVDRELNLDKLLPGIVAQVRKEMANKALLRKLPIQLRTYFVSSSIRNSIQAHPDKVPKEIIQI